MGHLSVDFRQREIRLLETEGSAKSLKVKKFLILDTLQEGIEMFEDETVAASISETLGHVLSKGRFTRDPTGMALGSGYCIFRDIELPFKTEDQIRKVIKFEVEGSLQADIDDVVVSFFKMTETLDKSYLMVLAARKKVLAKQLELLQGRDVDPYFIDLDILCMYNALAATGYLQELDRFVLVNVSNGSTHILVLNMGRMVWARSIPLGVGGMQRALEHDLKMARINPREGIEDILGITPLGDLVIHAVESPEEETEAPEIEGGEKSVSAMSREVREPADQRRSDFLNKLRRELLRTLAFLNMEEKPEKVLVTGGGCRLPGLDGLLEELFGAEVEELDILSRVGHSIPEENLLAVNREVCIPLGAAYKSAGHDLTRVDFRQEEVRYAKKFDQVKVPLACMVFLVLILVVLLNLEQFMLRRAKRSEMSLITDIATRQLGTALEDLDETQAVINRFSWGKARIDGIRRAIDSKKKQLGDLLGREGTIPELPSVFPIWFAFFDWIQNRSDDFEYFRLEKLQINMSTKKPTLVFDCQVSAETGRDEELLASTLIEDVPIFVEMQPGRSDPNPDTNKRDLRSWTVSIDLSKAVNE